MSNFDQITAIESNLARQLGWIAAADSKVAFVFTVDTAMLGVLAAVSTRSGEAWSGTSAFFAILTGVLGLLALLFLSFVTFPRTKGPKDSLIFFGGIIQHDIVKFQNAISQMTRESYISDLTSQCHRNAEVASYKFKWLKRALIMLYLSILPWVIAVFLLYRG